MIDRRDKLELLTLRDWLRYTVSRFNEAGLFFGHGSSEAYDEAVYLLLHTLALPIDRLDPFLEARLLPFERERLAAVLAQRINDRLPAAYITHEAWLNGYRFYVDERVIVPRSFLANMILDRFQPWLHSPVNNALDLCTGSGCLAILLAETYPDAVIEAIDLSPDALAVAHRNVADYGLEDRVHLSQGSLFAPYHGLSFDLIVANPPYVDKQAMHDLPQEYRHEPELALAAGDDGLEVIRQILAEARRHLNPGGLLAIEIGHNRAALEAEFPELPFTWPEIEAGTNLVVLIQREDLPA